MQYDSDRSGTVEPHELHAALAAFGEILFLKLFFSIRWKTSWHVHVYLGNTLLTATI